MILNKDKVELLLGERQMTLKKLVQKAKISKPTLQKIRNEQHVQPITAGKVASALKIPLIDLIKEATNYAADY